MSASGFYADAEIFNAAFPAAFGLGRHRNIEIHTGEGAIGIADEMAACLPALRVGIASPPSFDCGRADGHRKFVGAFSAMNVFRSIVSVLPAAVDLLSQYLPCSERKNITQETAAPRDFAPLYVADGSMH